MPPRTSHRSSTPTQPPRHITSEPTSGAVYTSAETPSPWLWTHCHEGTGYHPGGSREPPVGPPPPSSRYGSTEAPRSPPASPSRRRAQVLLHPPLQVHPPHPPKPPDAHRRNVPLLDQPVDRVPTHTEQLRHLVWSEHQRLKLPGRPAHALTIGWRAEDMHFPLARERSVPKAWNPCRPPGSHHTQPQQHHAEPRTLRRTRSHSASNTTSLADLWLTGSELPDPNSPPISTLTWGFRVGRRGLEPLTPCSWRKVTGAAPGQARGPPARRSRGSTLIGLYGRCCASGCSRTILAHLCRPTPMPPVARSTRATRRPTRTTSASGVEHVTRLLTQRKSVPRGGPLAIPWLYCSSRNGSGRSRQARDLDFYSSTFQWYPYRLWTGSYGSCNHQSQVWHANRNPGCNIRVRTPDPAGTFADRPPSAALHNEGSGLIADRSPTTGPLQRQVPGARRVGVA